MIEIVNLKEGDLFEYSIVLIFGRVEQQQIIEITTNGRSSIKWPVTNSYFKVSRFLIQSKTKFNTLLLASINLFIGVC